MTKKAAKKFPLIPLLIGAIVVVAIVGAFIRLSPNTPSRIQEVVDGTQPTLGPTSTPLKYTLENGVCVVNPNGSYPNLDECRKDQTVNTAVPSCPSYANYSITPCDVTEAIFVVSLTMQGVPVKADDLNDSGDATKKSEYFYCLKKNPQECGDDDLKSANDFSQLDAGSNTMTVTFPQLCGDGESKLKTKCKTNGSDYFHAGNTYRVSLFERKEKGSPVIRDAAFYVSHFYPTVAKPVQSSDDESLNITTIRNAGGYNLEVSLTGRNEKGNKTSGNTNDNDKYNDYWIIVEGFDSDYKSESKCLFVSESGGSATIRLATRSPEQNEPLTAGRYILKIKDGKDGKNLRTSTPECKENDFTYYLVPFTIGENKAGRVDLPIQDPYGKENEYKGANATPMPVCEDADKDENGYCTKIPTALGIKISTEPQFFIRDIFRVVLSIGGIAAVIFFIQAGYKIMTSAGDKEKMGQAREQVTSAIMGLIFIILSITILEFIGVQILQIPGFGR
ncbi:MAG: hypothetical protein KA035_01030 [Candidatus Levybacteria bacterium]|nr:hypothetical protein [Candidatus Levybacteria bacterium]